jgi:hypothetical protein
MISRIMMPAFVQKTHSRPSGSHWGDRAIAALGLGLLVGDVARQSPPSCWHPGLARNIGIAEPACP